MVWDKDIILRFVRSCLNRLGPAVNTVNNEQLIEVTIVCAFVHYVKQII